MLILLGPGADGYELVLIEKRSDLRSHAGQVAFPGGGIESVDVDPVAAALREAKEEVGVDPASGHGARGAAGGAHPPQRLRRHLGGRLVGGSGRRSSRSTSARWPPCTRWPSRTCSTRPTAAPGCIRAGFSGPAFELGDLYVWGFTAYLLDGLFDLLGWTLPWDTARTTRSRRGSSANASDAVASPGKAMRASR